MAAVGPPRAEQVGANLRRLRARRGLSLERLARLSGVSRAMLGQIELGRSMPSIQVVWKVAHALRVPLSGLIETERPETPHLLRVEHATRLVSADGHFVSRPLFPAAGPTPVEFYELTLAARSSEAVAAHSLGTRAYVVVNSGVLDITLGADRYCLGPDDALVFDADGPHSYENRGDLPCRVYLVLTLAAEVEGERARGVKRPRLQVK